MPDEPVLKLEVQSPTTSTRTDLVTGTVGLRIRGMEIEATMTIPGGPTRPRELLPALRAWTEAFVRVGVDAVEQEGKKISCRAGCGACCRQPVPITPAEAHEIAALVARLPEPRQSQVRAAFAGSAARMEQTGLRERYDNLYKATSEQIAAVGVDYFHLQMPCPFLEDESCSIHPERPLSCREYLVTSDAKYCRDPHPEVIDRIGLPGRMSLALARAETPPTPDDPRARRGWLPLILALDYAASHAEAPAEHPGPQVLRAVLDNLD